MDRTLDKNMARFLGWTWDEKSAYGPNGGAYARVLSDSSPIGDSWWWLAHYSTEIQEAMIVLEKLGDLYTDVVVRKSLGQWSCTVGNRNKPIVKDVAGPHWAETLELAICLTAEAIYNPRSCPESSLLNWGAHLLEEEEKCKRPKES